MNSDPPRDDGFGDGTRTNAELTEAAASKLRWITVARVVAELATLGSMVVLARLIPPSQFGIFAVVLIVQELAFVVPAEGVGSALVQRKVLRRDHLEGGMVSSLLVSTVLAATALILTMIVVAPVFGDETAELVLLACPWFLIGAVSAPPVALLRRRLDFRHLSIIELAASATRSAASVVLAAVAGLEATALVLGGLIGACVALTMALVFAPVPWPRWRPIAMRELLPYGGPAALAGVCWTGFRNGDYAVIGARLGSAQAGFYWRGFQLAIEYPRKLSTIMNQIAFPVLARTAGAEEMFALRRRMVQLLTVVTFPLLMLLIVLAPVVVPWLFGPAWQEAVRPAQILAGAGAATVVIDVVGSTFMAAGRSRALLGYGLAHFAFYVTAVYVAAGYGLVAVCVAAAISHGIFLVVAYHMLLAGRPDGTLRCLWKDVAAASVSSTALLAAAAPVEWALAQSASPVALHLLLAGGGGLLAYAASLRMLFPEAWSDLTAAFMRIVAIRRAGRVDAAAKTPLVSPPREQEARSSVG